MTDPRPTDRSRLLDDLAQTPGELTAVVRTSIGALARPGEWPLAVVVGHLLYVEQQLWQPRLAAMLTGAVPRWQRWEPDGIDWAGQYGAADPGELAARFGDARDATIERLSGLDEDGWQQRARHATFGDLDVADLMGQALRHDAEHVRQAAS